MHVLEACADAYLDAFIQTLHIGTFGVEQFVEDQSESRRSYERLSSAVEHLLSLLCSLSFAFVQFLLLEFLLQTRIALPARFLVDLLRSTRGSMAVLVRMPAPTSL